MNDTDYVAIVDTDRDELRDRIEDMRQRFYRLALSANPSARSPGSVWNVQQIMAHVVSVAQRYRAVADTGDFRRARTPRELDQINQDEMEALLAPIPILVDQLKALDPLMDAFFDSLTEDFAVEFHFGISELLLLPELPPRFVQLAALDLILHRHRGRPGEQQRDPREKN